MLRLAGLILVFVSLLIIVANSPQESAGLRAVGPDGIPTITCANIDNTRVELSKSAPVQDGKYFTGSTVTIDAIAQITRAVVISAEFGCTAQVQDVNDTEWQLTTKPGGSSASVTVVNDFQARLKPDATGTYIVTFTACPNGCNLTFPGLNQIQHIDPVSTTATMEATDTLPFPPQTQPVLPDFSNICSGPNDLCSNTDFSADAADKCNDGGGTFDPQWVTVAEDFNGPESYQLAEGVVKQSRVSTRDSWENHDSQDWNAAIDVDAPYRNLISTASEFNDPNRLGIEWESASYPQIYWPTIGDRVSVFGYWIHDCGHDGYYTEIHPAVGIAVHRARPVLIPPSEGLGDNVYAPGVVSDVFFNSDSGAATDCSITALHLPGHNYEGDYCVPTGNCDSVGSSCAAPLTGRTYTYNIYLPPSPETILSKAGHPNPPDVSLYTKVEGTDVLLVNPVTTADGVTYLEVTVQVGQGTSHDRVTAAWAYPSPNNWNLKQYQFRIRDLDVRDDADTTICAPFAGCNWGDWNLWANFQNTDQEWTKMYSCDGCIGDDTVYNYAPNYWQTDGSTGRDFGPNLMYYPEQRISFIMTGYEDDFIETNDNIGTVSQLIKQPDDVYFGVAANYCTTDFDVTIPLVDIDIWGVNCGHYFVDYQILPLGPVTATLSPAGQALYDASLVHASSLNQCFSHKLAIPCFDDLRLGDGWDSFPEGNHPIGPIDLSKFNAFEGQEAEQFVWTDIKPLDLKDAINKAPTVAVDTVLEKMKDKMCAPLGGCLPSDCGARRCPDQLWTLLLLEAVSPGEFQQHFGDVNFTRPIFGDMDCDLDIGSKDILVSLKASAKLNVHAPCFNLGDTNCDRAYDTKDTLSLLRFHAGINVASVAAATVCQTIGQGVKLHLLTQGPGTATPTRTPSPVPSFTPTPTATPTATPSPTPTPTPSGGPTPTADTTGPSVSNLTVNPDGSPGHEIYDVLNPMFCPNDSATFFADVSDPSGIGAVNLHFRFWDGVSALPGFSSGVASQLDSDTWQFFLNPPTMPHEDTPIQGRIDWYWEARDVLNNPTLSPAGPGTFNSTTVTDCNPIL